MSSNDNVEHTPWSDYMREHTDEYGWEDENEERLWYCFHGRAYGIRCKPCAEDDV